MSTESIEPQEVDDYVEEGGPGITDLPPGSVDIDVEAEPEGPLQPSLEWDQATIEQLLRGTGAGLHAIAGAGEQDWLMTAEDLERIAPPLTRIANRYEPALKLAPVADPILVAHGFALYGWRSALERKRALQAARSRARSARYEAAEDLAEGAASADGGRGHAEDLDGELGDLEGLDQSDASYFNT